MIKKGQLVEISEINIVGVVINICLGNNGKQFCEILELNNINTNPNVYSVWAERIK